MNTAKIGQSISKTGKKDNQTSNDSSEASLIISIKTGKALQYIIFVTILTIIMAIGLYEINKKILK